ncbi:MAG: phosphate ABC transporter permease PstA [Solirubrobacterales bacterium]|nr:phosphate ABC transporter permease PstA [Solirubrobacterales bacterium]MCB8971353.1 phosphate ABC transporter permease PstA [Thermoleophilales bacterium]MCO5325790.1 phosphate ABC transporter permease PstA [Solirubrobacterales bacterium]
MSATPATTPAPPPPAPPADAPPAQVEAPGYAPSWSVGDKIGVGLAWFAGLLLCVIAGSIVIYMLVRGIQYVSFDLLTKHPQPSLDQSKSGGFLDPIIGTFVLTILGTLIAAPLGVAIAVWLSEYGKPAWLARAVESGIEIVAGIPSIVLAIFGLLVFSNAAFGFLSFTAEGGAVFGRSFFTAGAMMGLLALPLVVGATREALQAIPIHVREASYALGKDRASTIRRVLLPAARPGIATGTSLGMGRIAGDTAIVVILLGASLQLQEENSFPILGDLKGTGSTLTSYVYNNSPAGEGNAPEKAYAAAFVLLAIVILLNFAVDLISRRRKVSWQS